MVIELTGGIKTYSERGKYDLSKLIMKACLKGHFIEMDYRDFLWFEKEFLDPEATLYYSELDKEVMREAIQNWEPSKMMSRTLSHVRIGDNQDSDLESLDAIVNNPSVVIVENGTNDWSAIQRWAKLYRKKKGYEDINWAVSRQIDSDLIEALNAGGNGGIVNEARRHIAKFKWMHSYKMLSVFDSDKSSLDDKDHNSTIKAELDNHKINWHELSKRAMENYFDWDCFAAIKCVTGNRPAELDENAWDYLDIERYLNNTLDKTQLLKNYEKSMMPNLSACLNKELLNRRLVHTGQTPDEIQQIILKLAKII